mmetsp:Transcript_22665/g.49797  ORF Transcript_22665/g.49797 Transcript_22665/m.49797 type:complete len:290 (-) Transcript_22665:57-926(-)
MTALYFDELPGRKAPLAIGPPRQDPIVTLMSKHLPNFVLRNVFVSPCPVDLVTGVKHDGRGIVAEVHGEQIPDTTVVLDFDEARLIADLDHLSNGPLWNVLVGHRPSHLVSDQEVLRGFRCRIQVVLFLFSQLDLRVRLGWQAHLLCLLHSFALLFCLLASAPLRALHHLHVALRIADAIATVAYQCPQFLHVLLVWWIKESLELVPTSIRRKFVQSGVIRLALRHQRSDSFTGHKGRRCQTSGFRSQPCSKIIVGDAQLRDTTCQTGELIEARPRQPHRVRLRELERL